MSHGIIQETKNHNKSVKPDATSEEEMTRFIGVAHRVKVLVKKDEPIEQRPTRVSIREEEKEIASYELATETEELDFIHGIFPVDYKPANRNEELSKLLLRQAKWRKLKKNEKAEDFPQSHLRVIEKEAEVVDSVPIKWDGLQTGDMAAFVLSGSGNRLAYAASVRGEQIGARIFHVPGFQIHDWRDNTNDSANDHRVIAEFLEIDQNEFYTLEPRDRTILEIRMAYTARIEAMKQRIAAEQRLRSYFMENRFCAGQLAVAEGKSGLDTAQIHRDLQTIRTSILDLNGPGSTQLKKRLVTQIASLEKILGTSGSELYDLNDLSLEEAFVREKEENMLFQAILLEEKQREASLKKLVEGSEIFQAVFSQVTGAGWAIASRLIADIGDIRAFATKPKFKAYCGVHVLSDGRLPRRRNNERANWKPGCRQALYLLGEQFNRRPDSVWGKKLRSYKEKLREKHPHPILVTKDGREIPLIPGTFEYKPDKGYIFKDGETVRGTKRYGNGHIHKMAMWRTITKFAEWLYGEWRRFSSQQTQTLSQAVGE